MTKLAAERLQAQDPETRFTSMALWASLGISALLCLVIGFSDVRFLAAATGFLGLTVLGTAIVRRLRHRHIGTGFFLVVATLNLLLVVPELVLRTLGYSHVARIEFGHPRPHHFVNLEPDEELFWKLPRSDPKVNSLGFLGPEPVVPKPPRTYRILFLGDSCMQWSNYPAMVDSLFETLHLPGPAVECVTLAMAGYSSHQGRILSQRYAERLQPDLTVVCYGWNDHWLAYGAPDAEKTINPTAMKLYNRIRLLQFVRAQRSSGEEVPSQQIRVPADQYRQNIAAIRDNLTTIGSRVVLLTAPTSHSTWGVPDYLIDMHFARSKKEALEIHAQYNEIVREAATGDSCMVFDLEKRFHGKEYRRLFWPDGIHFSKLGEQAVAQSLCSFILEQHREIFVD